MWTWGPSRVGIQSISSDPYFASVVFLCHFDGTNGATSFTDSSSYANHPAAYDNAQLSTTGPMYGTACATFDGAGDYALTPSYGSTPSTGTSPVCVEGWFYPTDINVLRAIAGIWTTGGTPNTWLVERNSANHLNFFLGNSSLGFNRITGTTAITANVWHHFALTRDGSAIRLWLDGTLEGSYSGTPGGSQSWDYNFPLNDVLIGAYRNTAGVKSEFWLGRIDEIRVTFGNARYTTPFTPTGPFPDY